MQSSHFIRSTLRSLAIIGLLACAACGSDVASDGGTDCDTNPTGGVTAAPSSGSENGSSTSNAYSNASTSGGSQSGGNAASTPPPGISGLFDTGVDDRGSPLPDGAIDPHYTFTSEDPGAPGPDAIAVEPVGTWTSNTDASKWISVNASTNTGNVEDSYAYSTSFTLNDVDPTTATISGFWACDDSCTMNLNGTLVRASYGAEAWLSLRPFLIPAGSPFKLGVNTLTILVDNSGGYPTGVQVADIVGSADPISSGGKSPSLPQNTTILDPEWQRTNEHFLAPSLPNPDLEYYAANSYPLFNEDNSAAGAAFTWTNDAWNGASTSDMPLDGTAAIDGFVPGDTWFWTYDRANDNGATATQYWFRANVDLGAISSFESITLADKYHPGKLLVNDGIIVFVNGVAQPVMPNLCDVPASESVTRDDSAVGWTFDGLPIALDAFHDGSNEIAVLYDERFGDGGLGHLVLEEVTQPQD